MDQGEEWLLRPVGEKMCLYESLLDCTLGLEDIARMNEYLDIQSENERRYRKANEE